MYVHFQFGISLLFFIISISTFSDIPSWDVSSYPEKLIQQLENAKVAFKNKKFVEVLHLYQSMSIEAPKLPDIHIGLGDTLAKLGRFSDAIPAFKRALQLIEELPQQNRFSIEPTVQAKLATAYHRIKQLNQAEIWFRKAISGVGKNVPVKWYIALAQIETERNNLEKARRYYIVAVQISPETTAAFNNLGHVLLKLNRIDEADAVFREALNLDKTLASAIYGRGRAAEIFGNHSKAKSLYQQAINENPNEPIFYKSLSEILTKLGDTEAANEAKYRYKHTLAEIYRKQAHKYIEKKQGVPAIELLQKALNVYNTHVPALKDLAYVQMQLKDLHSAKQTYNQVLKLEPESRQALLHLAMIEIKLNNISQAESHLLTLIKAYPNFMDAYSQLANLHKSTGDFKAAENVYTMGIQKQPNWAPGFMWRGQIFQKLGASVKAENDFRQAIKLATEVAYPKDALAYLLASENRNLTEALKLSKEAVATDKLATHIATLAFVNYRLGRLSEAKREINSAFSREPKNPYILKIRDKILKTNIK